MCLHAGALHNVALARIADIRQIPGECLMIPCQPDWRLQNQKTQTGVCVERHSLEVDIMKVIQSLIVVASVAAAVALPSVSFAQSNQPLTRAEVRANWSNCRTPAITPRAIKRSIRRTSRPQRRVSTHRRMCSRHRMDRLLTAVRLPDRRIRPSRMSSASARSTPSRNETHRSFIQLPVFISTIDLFVRR